jgi:putative membrane protein
MRHSILVAGSLMVGMLVAPLAAQADSPHAFLDKALKGDNSEIMLGKLAVDRAGSRGVRNFGKTLVQDHRQARNQVLDVGQRFGLRADRDPTQEAREEQGRLSNMGGRDFDREFVHYMVNDHRNDIADFRDEAREGHGAVSMLARRQLPVLQKHLNIALSLDHGDRRLSRNYERNRGYSH